MIFFTGDSFSANNSENSWVKILSDKLNLPYENTSVPGSSLWHAYTSIQKNKENIYKKKFEYIIITCTNHHRIPTVPDPKDAHWLGNPGPITQIPKEIEKSIAHFCYFNYFFNENFHKWVYKNILSELSYELPMHVKKVIFLGNFDESVITLSDVYKMFPNFLYNNISLQTFARGDDIEFPNHMTTLTNKNLANILYEEILKKEAGSIDFTEAEIKKLKPNFNFGPWKKN